MKPVEIPDFYSVCCNATRSHKVGRPKGGVAVLYNQKLGNMETLLAEDNCIVMKGDRINVVARYIQPPKGNDETVLDEKLTQCLQLVCDRGITVLAGDFNVRYDRPDDRSTISFIKTITDFGLWIPNDPQECTSNFAMGSSTIDLFATNLPREEVSYNGSRNSLCEGGLLTNHVPVSISIRPSHPILV